MIRVRTANEKDIKKWTPAQEPTPGLAKGIAFLKDILAFIEDNLYLDKPVEAALPYFEILRIIIELFGDFEYKLRVTNVYPACNLLSKIGYFNPTERHALFIFLVNSMKSTWAQIRIFSYSILGRFPDDYGMFHNEEFVNGQLFKMARDLANNPKAMMAEASALYHNLLFKKCLPKIATIPEAVRASGNLPQMQLAFLNQVLSEVGSRVKTFQVALIKEGKKEALLHGYLSFFKHLFEDFKIDLVALL